MSRASYWVFTLNNYTDEEVTAIDALVDGENPIVYLSYGKEVGEQGTPHLQGHVELQSRVRLPTLASLLPRCHLEVRKGSFEQAQQYVEKDGDFVVFGERASKGQGKRSDLEALHEDLRAKKKLKAIADEHFGSFLRYERGIRSYKLLHDEPRRPDRPPAVVVYWGLTGTGKTRSVFDNAPALDDVWTYPGNGWFDGYEGQRIALFDDFRGSSLQIAMLLRVLDRYPMQVPIKGGHVCWRPEEIYITSNVAPHLWYTGVSVECVNALIRRLTNTVHFE